MAKYEIKLENYHFKRKFKTINEDMFFIYKDGRNFGMSRTFEDAEKMVERYKKIDSMTFEERAKLMEEISVCVDCGGITEGKCCSWEGDYVTVCPDCGNVEQDTICLIGYDYDNSLWSDEEGNLYDEENYVVASEWPKVVA